jgi:hypothetical protein
VIAALFAAIGATLGTYYWRPELAGMRYFFDITDGETRSDDRGVELPNDGAARQEARLRALDHKSSYALERYGGDHRRISVRDEADRIICEIPLES